MVTRWAWLNQGSHSGEMMLDYPVKVRVLVAQSCPPLFDSMDYSPPGSSVRAILEQEYWSGLQFLSPGDLPHSGVKPGSPALQADS